MAVVSATGMRRSHSSTQSKRSLVRVRADREDGYAPISSGQVVEVEFVARTVFIGWTVPNRGDPMFY